MFKIIKFIKYPLNINLLERKNFIKNINLYNNNGMNLMRYVSNINENKFQKYKINEITKCNDNNNNNQLIDKDKKLKILELEIDVGRHEGRKVPDPKFLTTEHWEHLLTLNTRSSRIKYYTFLWKLEKKKENDQIKKLKKQEEIKLRKEKEKLELDENNHIIYGLAHTGFLLRIYETTMNNWHNNKLIQAMQFGQKLIFDCSYDEHMTKREAINTAKQLMLCFAENRIHNEPFDLHFCNINMKNSVVFDQLKRYIPTILENSFPLNVHERCFTEIFPKQNLVYLTPHCKNDLNEFNADDLYIIGSIVDKINNEPLSLAKAKRLGIRMARLPLDKYLQWGSGSGKSLTLNQMINILLDLKTTKDWNYSLRHVPKRKIIDQLEHDKMLEMNKKFKYNKRKTNKLKIDINNWLLKDDDNK